MSDAGEPDPARAPSRYLGDASLAIYEVAFLLGYAETRSCHRAFKRWTGEGERDFAG